MAPDPYRYFRIEGRELLEQLGRGTLELERGTSPEQVARLLRLAHTLKGAARVVKQRAIADGAHAFEELLAPHRTGDAAVPRSDIQGMLGHLDVMTAALRTLDDPPVPAPATVAEPAAAVPAPAAAIATPPAPSPPGTAPLAPPENAEVSELIEALGEVRAQAGALRKVTLAVEEARSLALRLGDGSRAARASAETAPDQPRGPGELGRALERARAALAAGLDQLERETDQARELAERLRLVPASTMFTSLQRTARDAAVELGRVVAFEGSGGDVRLDPAALAAIQAALVQLVRNAVAHGIEPPGARSTAGKAAEGRVVVTVERRRADIVFTCRDDGKGIDLEAVRAIARQKGLLTTAGGADPDELLAALLRGGISTSPTVTAVSGRGVGLDVARAAVAELKGTLSVHSRPGAGTTVSLTVPAVIAAVPALMVESAGTTAAIPLDAVRGAVRVRPEDVARRPEGDALVHEGRVLPLFPLAAALELDGARAPRARSGSALVVERDDGARAALAVDRLLGTATVISRPLPARAVASAVVAGAWMDAAGTPQLVLDPAALVARALRPVPRARDTEPSRAPVLVIDDSLTTRMLEQSILESAGYQVETAASAEEGLEKAAAKRYALFLVDVEMPGMDGFTFVECTRRDPTLREIPAILVSSRAAPEDLRRGEEAGAAAYIVKGDFDQVALLNRIRTLVH